MLSVKKILAGQKLIYYNFCCHHIFPLSYRPRPIKFKSFSLFGFGVAPGWRARQKEAKNAGKGKNSGKIYSNFHKKWGFLGTAETFCAS
jgi:hypothetical protein